MGVLERELESPMCRHATDAMCEVILGPPELGGLVCKVLQESDGVAEVLEGVQIEMVVEAALGKDDHLWQAVVVLDDVSEVPELPKEQLRSDQWASQAVRDV